MCDQEGNSSHHGLWEASVPALLDAVAGIAAQAQLQFVYHLDAVVLTWRYHWYKKSLASFEEQVVVDLERNERRGYLFHEHLESN
jgi:hypothetical protein